MWRKLAFLLTLLLAATVQAQEPVLPGGLGSGVAEPPLPGAATIDRKVADDPLSAISGFVEARLGLRITDDSLQRRASIAESRAHVYWQYFGNGNSAGIAADLAVDDIDSSESVHLQDGRGWLDLREAWWQTALGPHAEIKAGRQILTWGVGDLLFLNDLFPKDWNSFFIGRDQEYLKAPSDSLKLAWFADLVNLNLVVSPSFDADRYIDGRRISWFDAARAAPSGRDLPVQALRPDDAEFALRLYRQTGTFETALYAYDGAWKSPAGRDALSGEARHPALRVFGASLRGPVGPGIFSGESAWYDSRQDRHGSDRLVANSEARVLLGYEMELLTNLTAGLQYYVEVMDKYSNYRRSLDGSPFLRDRVRELISLRLTWLRMNQNLTLSLFSFLSPSDRDLYLRPRVQYQVDDHFSVDAGANLFAGRQAHTFLGQFEQASNVYLGVRYAF